MEITEAIEAGGPTGGIRFNIEYWILDIQWGSYVTEREPPAA